MTAAELEAARTRLEDLAAELERQIARPAAADSSISPDNAIGRLTRMEALQAQQIGAAGRRRLEQRLRNVHRALKAIAAGTYGVCGLCGGQVPSGRLAIMPETRVCVRCAGR